MTKNKKLIAVFVLIVICSWGYMLWEFINSGESDNKPKAKNEIGQMEALTLCQDYYENLYEKGTGFDAKIGMLSDYKTAENTDTWIFTVWGKCQNSFGAWMHIPAQCIVKKISVTENYFDYSNIVEFEFKR